MSTITYSQCPLCKSEDISLYKTVKDYSFSQEDFDICRCKNCTFLFTQNIPSPEKIGHYYQSDNYVSHTNTKKGLFFKLYHIARDIALNSKKKLIEKYLGKSSGKLLDIGAATGYFSNHMKTAGYDVKAVEVDEDSRNFCESNFGIKSSAPDVFFANNTESFDVITMWHVLEHVHDLHEYVQNLHQLVTDDGIVVIAVPNHASTDRKFFKEYWAAYDIPIHLWHFEPQTMERLFAEHGFKLVKKKSMPFDSFYVSMLSYKAKKNPLYFIFGFLYGLIPFFNQMMNVNQSTSLTYIFKKK